MTTRLERAFTILRLLRTGAALDVVQLSEQLGINRRTVFRDIAALRSLGFVIEFDSESTRYVLVSEPAAGKETPSPLAASSADEARGPTSQAASGSATSPLGAGDGTRSIDACADPGAEVVSWRGDADSLDWRAVKRICLCIEQSQPVRCFTAADSRGGGDLLIPIELSYSASGWTLVATRVDDTVQSVALGGVRLQFEPLGESEFHEHY